MRPYAFVPTDAPSTSRADPRLAALRLWLSAGTAMLLLMPVEAWYHPVVGWLPYWWVVMPAIGLALLRRGYWLRRAQAWLAGPSFRRATLARRRRRRGAAHRTRPHLAPGRAPALIRG